MTYFLYIASYILFFIVLLFSFSTNYLHYMHIFQLNSYSCGEQFHWIKQNIKQVVGRHILPLIVSIYALIAGYDLEHRCWEKYATNDIFSSQGNIALGNIERINKAFQSGSVTILLTCISFLLLGMIFFIKKEPVKKKLVFTPRVIRMCVTTVIIYGAVCALSMIFLWEKGLHFFALCLWQIFSLFMPMIANFINKPIEKSINNYYINDAKKIIDGLPNLTVIGITGSYGKTSTKFYLNKLLSAKYNVLITPESYNTTMGVVKTIRNSLNATYEYFICEMGAKGVGEIKEICDIVHPRHSMITSIGEQHLETFKSVDNIIKTKFEIADCITSGMVFLNFDNEYISKHSEEHTKGKNVISYGFNPSYEYYADHIRVTVGGTEFTVHHGKESADFSTRLIGAHNVQNILGAIAVANKLGISFDQLKMPVHRLEAVPHRMQIIDKGSSVVIDDAFNSNPAGAKAALDAMGLMEGYKILVTPGMVDLGEKEYELNKELGKQAAQVSDFVIAVGENRAEPIVDGLKEAGYPEEKTFVAKNLNDALAKCDSIKTGGIKKIILLENDLPDNY